MRSKLSLSLPPELKLWVDEQARAGSYSTPAEYLREMLRRARERHARRELDKTLMEAVESGATITMDKADWAEIRRAARAQPKRRATRGASR